MRVCGVYFVFVILLSACTNGVSHLDIALQQAKHNKAELEKVLKHFKELKQMEKWVCDVCGYIYDPEIGDPDT